MTQALYRRYRPETFAEVIGQEHVTEPLQQALPHDRIHHAYLFSGPRGCGKTTSARILARCLNCEQGPTPTPCGVCQSCQDLGPRRRRQPRRHRDRRGHATAASTTPATCASGRSSPRRRRASRSTSSTRRTWCPGEGFNALLKLVEEPPRAREVRLRDHRAGQGHRDDPVAHPPLPVPAGAAGRAAGLPGRASCEQERRRRRPGGALAGGAGRPRLGPRLAQRPRPAARRRRRRGRDLRRSPPRCSATPTRSLLDDTVDAFAAGDGAAVFRDRRPGRRGRPRPAPVRRGPARAAARPDHHRRRARRRRQHPRRAPRRRAGADAPAGRPLRRAPSCPAPPTSSTPASPRCAAPPRPGCSSS